MDKYLNFVTDEEAQKISRLMECFDRSTVYHIELKVGDVALVMSKGPIPQYDESTRSVAKPGTRLRSNDEGNNSAEVSSGGIGAKGRLEEIAAGPSEPDGDVADVQAPVLGIFYPRPEPGQPPFVSIGSQVREDTTVALIEVMKTFNAIPAGVRGKVTDVCAQENELVEFGQVLFRISLSSET